MWYATDAFGQTIEKSAKRLVMDKTSKEIFAHTSESRVNGSTEVDIKLTETVTVDLCAKEITGSIPSPIIFASCDNLCCVYGVAGRRVSSFAMLKLVKNVLKSFDELGIALPLTYVPTTLNPSDGLTREGLLQTWNKTFPHLKYKVLASHVLNGYASLFNEHCHISAVGTRMSVKRCVKRKRRRGNRKKK
jgi:hypothetical protein